MRLLHYHPNAMEASREAPKLGLVMSISVQINDSQKIVTITIIGSFDFSLFNDFRAAYSDLSEVYNIYIIDMQMVEYLDSAALGMLLSMRNAIDTESEIQLKGANDFIKNILMISRFDKRFNIQ
ncbi:STAS domain-containing protein [Marinomonas sp. CT5]|uniref:STAS domain-containing protein n=1 Tax=Marinomonas sp. CT5 TaxID=2066133 RepID=UPI0020167D8B|nr:STAS domain-containing protein [Marinomonas sp. CT5]